MKVLLVTSRGGSKVALAAVRSLGRAGARAIVGSARLRGRALRSRYCHGTVELLDPREDPSLYRDCLLSLLRRREYDVLLPVGDDCTLAIARHREELEVHVRIPIPDLANLTKATDKLQALGLARSLGIEIPRTHAPESLEQAKELSQSLAYPCVLKPRRGAGAVGVRFPRSAEELVRTYSALPWEPDLVLHPQPLIQERVPGEIHDVCLLFNRGEPRAALTQRRLKMYPPTGGEGLHVETTDEPELRDKAIRLLRALHWHGPAQVEFKIDSRTGDPTLMEINARFWGSLELSVRAGVDFPLLTCRMAVEGDVDPVFDYRVGLRYRLIFPNGVMYALWGDRPWRELWELFRIDPGSCSEFRVSDPLPALIAMVWTLPRILEHRRHPLTVGRSRRESRQ